MHFSIACISCPTLYSKLLQYGHTWDHDRAVLLEYDERFFMFGDDYIYYDYKDPLKIPDSIQRLSFDLVVADPPFLSEECLTKVAQTIKLLNSPKILLCTGQFSRVLKYTYIVLYSIGNPMGIFCSFRQKIQFLLGIPCVGFTYASFLSHSTILSKVIPITKDR